MFQLQPSKRINEWFIQCVKQKWTFQTEKTDILFSSIISRIIINHIVVLSFIGYYYTVDVMSLNGYIFE